RLRRRITQVCAEAGNQFVDSPQHFVAVSFLRIAPDLLASDRVLGNGGDLVSVPASGNIAGDDHVYAFSLSHQARGVETEIGGAFFYTRQHFPSISAIIRRNERGSFEAYLQYGLEAPFKNLLGAVVLEVGDQHADRSRRGSVAKLQPR